MKKTLSVCMIVRDEEENIEAVLSQAVQFGDEIVVVDTGSKDRTMEIIQNQFPAVQLYHFRWRDDFSAARNYSIDQATCDYILILDADDRVDEKSIAKINKLKNYMDGTVFSFIIVNLQSDGTYYLYPNQTRCFPNRPDLRYEGWVHNDISQAIYRLGLKEENKKIFIEHLGFSSPEMVKQKHARARKILEKELKVKPDDMRIHTYLGVLYEEKAAELKEANKGEQAKQWYKKALKHLERAIIALEPEFPDRPWGLFQALPAACRASVGLGERPRARWYWYKLSVFLRRYPQLMSYASELAEDTGIYDELYGT